MPSQPMLECCPHEAGVSRFHDAREGQLLRYAVETTIESRLGVSSDAIHGTSRGKRHVVFARHLTLYLAQSVSGAYLSEVGVLFGYDRQVVAYAMRRIEDCRDDARWDRTIDLLTAETGRTYAWGRARNAAGLPCSAAGVCHD